MLLQPDPLQHRPGQGAARSAPLDTGALPADVQHHTHGGPQAHREAEETCRREQVRTYTCHESRHPKQTVFDKYESITIQYVLYIYNYMHVHV